MRERKLPAEALALRYLRAESGWSKERLAAELGFSDARLILRYERGDKLELLDKALNKVRRSPEATGRILLKKEFVLQQTGDLEGALATLKEAMSSIEKSADPLLLFALRFNLADVLCRLGRFAEAEPLLPLIRDMAVRQAKELQLIRVLWLESKIAAGQDRMEEAVSALQQVRRDFSAHQLPYEAALASLDLAVLWLRNGRSAEVKDLAREMAWVFGSKRIQREALAALQIFCEAARQESASVELTLKAIAEIERARRSIPHGRRGTGA